ncbi:MAG TPA: NAD(P)H-dependent oxidoreductase [Aggregatilinea sp.]|jgi:chromate reductase|uniref:NADPH-dependent FMN reductase n=1 Tax=Aggregatilinea sp. TaxID=2806333 RepID=UPI002C8385F8|nr:NAD(P)H-dependent oxidoreductase [Aggregatilinea sp.]HML21926.1 NAD(P)H-dependent oxidoreductase [Aggregatilinea sp.]
MNTPLVTQEADQFAPQELHVLGFAGSLRQNSYNRALLRAAQELMPDGMSLSIFDLSHIPLYNADLDQDGIRPPAIELFKQAIAKADALLIATPEYNHSMPGVLKNALDWASRPAGRSPMSGKPAAMMGATGGLWGTIRAQDDLRNVLTSTGSHVMLRRPEILIAQAPQKFDEQGRLTDDTTRTLVTQLLVGLRDWTLRLRAGEPVPAAAPTR